MSWGLAWLLVATTSSTGSATDASSSTSSTGSSSGSSTTGSSSDTTGSSSGSSGTTSTSDHASTFGPCLSAPYETVSESSADEGGETGPCLSINPATRVDDGCGCRQRDASPVAMMLALFVLALRRRSRRDLVDDLATSGRLPHDVIARLRGRVDPADGGGVPPLSRSR